MASITKRGKMWRAQIAVKGTRESATLNTKAEAIAWAAERETEIRKGLVGGFDASKTCGDAFARYVKDVSARKAGGEKTQKWEGNRLHFIGNQEIDGKKIKDIKLVDLTSDMLGRWRDQRLQVVGSSTVNRDFALVSNVFAVASREWKWVAQSPTSDVRRPQNAPPRDRRPTDDEINRLCLACGFDDGPVTTKMQAVAVAFLFAIETAMRANEVCKLQRAWIKGNVAHLPAEANKNRVKRDVPLSKRAVQLLELLPEVEAGPVFGLTEASLDALFRKAKNRAQVTELHFHDTRHEAITRLAKKLDVLALARMVGHRDLRMLQVYYNESAAELAARLD